MTTFGFTDNLDIVSDQPIKVLATISMVPREKGGRHGPFSRGFRPNHNFGAADDRFFFIGQIEVPENELIYPGDVRDLYVTFLDARGLRELLTEGRTWHIQEGPRLIGTGKVISIG